MNKAFEIITACLVSAILLMTLHCGTAQDVSSENGVISGVIYEPDGKPAAGAVVLLRSWDYLPEISLSAKRSARNDGFFVCSTFTDNTGSYCFTEADSIPDGQYILMARDSANNSVLMGNVESGSTIYCVTIEIDSPLLFSGTLKSPGSIRGQIRPPGDSITVIVRVIGFDQTATIRPDGSFILENLPEAKLYLQFYCTFDEKSYDTVMVLTRQNEPVALDSVVLPRYYVIYDGNGNTAGYVPIDERWYRKGESARVSGNTGNLQKTGFTFTGWDTEPDGSGTLFTEGDSIQSGITLFAQWTPDSVELPDGIYELKIADLINGSVSGAQSFMAGQRDSIALDAKLDIGYKFVKWKITEGSALIGDSTAVSTWIVLNKGNATVQGIYNTITFQKTFGGTNDDRCFSVQQTSDGGYIAAGFTEVAGSGNADIYLIKTNEIGNIFWARTFGGAYMDISLSVQQSSDNGYIIAGASDDQDFGGSFDSTYNLNGNSNSASSHILLMKTVSNGDTVWTRGFGDMDEGCSVKQTNDDGYIIVKAINTWSESPATGTIYLIKTDGNGDILWTKTYYTTYAVVVFSLQHTIDNGYIITGFSQFSGNADVYLMKTDASGDTVWTRTFGGAGFDCGRSVLQSVDGGFVIAGETELSGSGGSNIHLIKTDGNGNSIWTRTYGGTKGTQISNSCDHPLQQTSDGGYVIVGTCSISAENTDIYLIKTDATGDTLWTRTFGGIGFEDGHSVWQTRDSGYIVAGDTYHYTIGHVDILLIKTDENGNVAE